MRTIGAVFDELSASEATALLRACADVPEWADALVAFRPYGSVARLLADAERRSLRWTPDEVRRAIASRPRLGGAIPTDNPFSRGEQTMALSSDAMAMRRLRERSKEYEKRFGMIFLIAAEGRGAAELLAELERRLVNDAETELAEAANELRRIALVRLARSVADDEHRLGSQTGELLLINPNVSARTTAILEEVARLHVRELGLEDRVSVRAVAVTSGPDVIVDATGLRAAAKPVAETTLAEVGPRTLGVVVGAIGDPGVAELRDMVEVPVIGLGEAAVRAAARDGRRFGIVTTTPLLVASLQTMAEHFAGEGSFTGVRLTDSSAATLADRPDLQELELEQAGRLCHDTDGAEVVIIGGGPLGESARALGRRLGLSVVQPLPVAIDHVLTARGLVASPG